MFYILLLYVHSCFAIILMGEERELAALLSLSSWCLVIVVWLFLSVPWVCLQFVILTISGESAHLHRLTLAFVTVENLLCCLKETKSATINIFEIFYFVFKSFVKVELSYIFTKNLFTIAENCKEK